MRIISGDLKGKSINFLKSSITRPLKDSVRENIFNILNHSNLIDVKLAKANILDLYSGIGSFGLECLSRGSSKVTFAENYNNALIILKKNISNLNFQDSALIIENNILDDLNFKNFGDKFDIIFVDPPYKETKLSILLVDIINSNILKKNGIIIVHRHKKEEDKLPEKFKILEKKSYGISKIIFGSHY